MSHVVANITTYIGKKPSKVAMICHFDTMGEISPPHRLLHFIHASFQDGEGVWCLGPGVQSCYGSRGSQ